MLPKIHPKRRELNDEVHARPPEAMAAPLRLSYIVLLSKPGSRAKDLEPVRKIARLFGATAPQADSNHYSEDLGPFHLRWERHTEFSRYTFNLPGAGQTRGSSADPFAAPAIGEVPADWLAALPGQVIVAAHVTIAKAPKGRLDLERISQAGFGGNALVGGAIAGGAGVAVTDFHIHDDGFSRLLVYDRAMTPRQTGRMVQRVLELETYRVMALLALPVARALSPFLDTCKQELAKITAAMAAGAGSDETELLERLIRLEAAIEKQHAESHYRFGAAAAYYDLVHRRTAELREERVKGVQTFREFTERRLAPAMNTCRSVATLQESLSERVARATQLLSTRIDIARQEQNQAVLESMNRRAKLQLRLQQTVEALSVAAVTYYVVGLVGYATKGLKTLGLAVSPELVMAASIPFVLVAVALVVRRVRKVVTPAKSWWRS